MLVAVHARTRGPVARELRTLELVHAQRLEGVADERNLPEPDEPDRDVRLVEEETAKHEKQDDEGGRELRRHLHRRETRRQAHAEPDAREVLEGHHREEDEVVANPLAQAGHVIDDRAVHHAGYELQRQRDQKGGNVVGQRRVHPRRALPADNLELLRDDLRDADGGSERLVHRLEEEDPGAVLDAGLVARHPQVHHAKKQRKERLHDVLDGERRRVPRLLPPRPRQQKLERNPKPARVFRVLLRLGPPARRETHHQALGVALPSRHVVDELDDRHLLPRHALRQLLDALHRRFRQLGRAIIHGDDVEEVVRGVEVLRHGLAQRGEVRRARALPGSRVNESTAAEEHELVDEGVDAGPGLVHGRDDGPTLLDGEVLERGHDVEGLEGVETGRGLVHEDEPRVVKEVHADRDPLALATGNAADLLISDDGIRSCD